MELLQQMSNNCFQLGEFFVESLRECIELLKNPLELTEYKISAMPNFSRAWGRGQQYMSIKAIIE